MLIKIENKKQNKFIVSERLYIGITDTINGFRSTLACCEDGGAVRPSYGVGSMDPPDRTRVISSKEVGRGVVEVNDLNC